MKLLFHYHIPYTILEDGSICTQSFFGVFIDSLAKHFNQIVILGYETIEQDLNVSNYQLKATNIEFHSLGVHNGVPKRILRAKSFTKKANELLKNYDVFLVRGPTPMSLFLTTIKQQEKIVLYLVGDYIQGLDKLAFNPIKNFLLRRFFSKVEATQKKIVAGKFYLANNQKLIDVYKEFSPHGKLVRTTTIFEKSILKRDTTIPHSPKLLFTGRIAKAKGVFDILDACLLLQEKGHDVTFHLAGIDEKDPVTGKSTVESLKHKTTSTIMDGKLIYHGLKKVGDELNQVYNACDIYVIASQYDFEGFPRTIWEALASNMPVIASAVGGIPHFLKDKESALLIEPFAVHQICSSVETLIADHDLVNKLRDNGEVLVRENTIEKQSKRLFDLLNERTKIQS